MSEEIIEINTVKELADAIKGCEDFELNWHVWINSEEKEKERMLVEIPFITVDADKKTRIVNIVVQFQDVQLEHPDSPSCPYRKPKCLIKKIKEVKKNNDTKIDH